MNAHELAERLTPLFPTLDDRGRRLSLQLYRKLALGAPVDLTELFDELDLDGAEGRKRIRSWPGVYYDGEGCVIGYWGLTLAPMQHRLHLGERELFAWCAWDTLFLPGVLGAYAEASSTCRGTGAPVRLSVGTTAVESADPPGLAVSFIPPSEAVQADVITSFCHYVHFFSSERAAAGWLEQHPHAFVVPLADAFEVGRLLNRKRYGAALGSGTST